MLAITLADRAHFPNVVRALQTRTLTVGAIPGAAGAHMQDAATRFTAANPDVNVQVNIASGAETYWKPNFPQIVSSSDKPDFAWYWVDGRQYQDIANAGLLEPLDDLYASEAWDKALPQSVQNTYTSPDGHKYAVCETIVWYPQIYYSREAFSKAGIEEPTDHYFASLDDFYAACDKLRTAGYEPLTLGGGEGWILGHTRDALQSRVATDEQMQELLTNWQKSKPLTLKLTEPPWSTATQLLLEFSDKKVFADGYLGRSYADGRALFVQGKAGMYQDGSWAATADILYKEAPDLDFGWMIFPQVMPDISAKFLLYGGNGLMIPAGGPNVELAKEFMKFIMSQSEQEEATKNQLIVSARNDVPAEAVSAAGPHIAEMFPLLTTYGTSTGWDDPAPAALAERSLVLWGDLLSGRSTPEDVDAELEKLVEDFRNQ
jgi:ABC-type glycerol-3-phosphate transport system substrate-binding protein